MQKAGVFRGVVALACAVAFVIPAFADIRAFNAAVKAGDYRKAATEAKASWKEWDRADPDTAVVAREFGFASYMAGDFAAAREFGRFLKDNGARLSTPDSQPDLSNVLFAAAGYRLEPGAATRDALLDALKARERRAGIDMQSVLAAEALYRGDWSTGNWGGASESAALADRLLARGGAQLLSRTLDARATAAVSGFMGGRDKQDYEKIVKAHNDVVAAIDAAPDPRQRAILIPLKFRLEAWSLSVSSYFKATQQTGSLISKDVKTAPLRRLERAPFDDMQTGPDPCEGDIDIGSLRYPLAAEYRGMVGTVIMRYDSDGEGRITRPEILAAVPMAQFAEQVVKAAADFRLKRTAGDKPSCSLAGTSRLVRIIFQIL